MNGKVRVVEFIPGGLANQISSRSPALPHKCGVPAALERWIYAAEKNFVSHPKELETLRPGLLNGIDQRRHAVNTHFQPVAGFDWPDSAGRAGEDHVAGQQGHVCRDEANKLKAIENELAGAGVLSQLSVLEKLNGQIVRIDLGFDVRPERRECVERLGTGPLALTVLNRAIADILRRSVS